MKAARLSDGFLKPVVTRLFLDQLKQTCLVGRLAAVVEQKSDSRVVGIEPNGIDLDSLVLHPDLLACNDKEYIRNSVRHGMLQYRLLQLILESYHDTK